MALAELAEPAVIDMRRSPQNSRLILLVPVILVYGLLFWRLPTRT